MWLNITSSFDKKCWSRWIQPVTSSSMVQSWSVVTSPVKVKVNRWIRCDVTLMMSLMCLRDTKRHEQECVRQNPKLFCCFSISISSQISFFNFWIGQCFGLVIGQLSFLSENALFCEGQPMLTFMMFTCCNNNYISLGLLQCNVAKRWFSRCKQLGNSSVDFYTSSRASA